MTTIITRLYPTQSAANAARASLLEKGQNEDTIQIILGGKSDEAAAAMNAARVSKASAAAYLQAMTGTQALLVVQAPFNLIGTAQKAMRVLQKHPAMDVGLADEDVYLREYPDARFSNSIMNDHPLFMSNPFRRLSHGHIFGSNPIMESKPRTSAMRGCFAFNASSAGVSTDSMRFAAPSRSRCWSASSEAPRTTTRAATRSARWSAATSRSASSTRPG